MTTESVIRPGENCWKTAHAERAALLIDGENYYRAFHEAVCNARHSIVILAWDIDSRMRLLRGDQVSDDVPSELGHLLCYALQRQPDLNVYILNWDWAMLYTFEREWLPTYRPLWKDQQRLHFKLDGECPTTASQHQKVILIDDQIAFCGGFDLGKNRWDSRQHKAEDSRRLNPDNTAFPPFHDVMWLVDGEAAKALAELARVRWQRVTGDWLPAADNPQDCWPQSVAADFENIDLAIARTQSEFKDWPTIHEVEQLFVDTINQAEKLIYFENQYFTSWRITDLLSKRLQEANGPEVIIVLPKMTGGWLEQNTMDVIRARLMRQLQAADLHDRLRVCFPHRDELGDGFISVHSKTTVIDDQFLRVGSSNLSNRSMGLDSECDLLLEAQTAEQSEKISHFRNDLLSEHLGLEQPELKQLWQKHGSLRGVIDAREGSAHTLRPLDCRVNELADELLPEDSIVDLERPLDAEAMAQLLVPIQQRQAFKKQWLTGIGIILLVIALTLIWQFTPLGEWLSEENLQLAAESISDQPLGPLLVLLVFALCCVFAVPVSLLIIATMITFGPWVGSAYALSGSLLGGVMGFYVGHFLGRGAITQIAGSRVSRLSQRLAKQGLLAIITVRIVPVAPFTVINMVAGASHIKIRDFFLGTLLGMIPGITALAVFADSLMATLKQPQPEQIAILAGVLLLIFALSWGLQKFFRTKTADKM